MRSPATGSCTPATTGAIATAGWTRSLRANVNRLHVKWVYQMKTTHHVETTPLVVDGIMYATRPPNDVVALDTRDRPDALALPLSGSR